jgi:hypothetical protein
MMASDTKLKITGAAGNLFERGRYAIHDHGDGTATIVLDMYETSNGRDFMGFETFMRTEIDTARKFILLLNACLPGRIDARLEYPVPDDE